MAFFNLGGGRKDVVATDIDLDTIRKANPNAKEISGKEYTHALMSDDAEDAWLAQCAMEWMNNSRSDA